VTLIVVAAVAVWAGRPESFDQAIRRAEAAYARGDWAGAVRRADRAVAAASSQPRSLRLRARAALRLGRVDEARRDYARLTAESLEAEDLALLGQAWLKAGDPVLGLTALETAPALEPGHAESRDALAAAYAVGDALTTAAESTERLGAIPEDSARASLLLELLRLQVEDPALASEIRDRILQRDRATFATVTSAAAAVKLAARALLEAGRPAEARERLRLLLGTRPDPEASWLLSRASLQRGEADSADEALARASGYGPEDPTTPEPSPFTGAARCGECHRDILRAQQASRHAGTFHRGAALADIPLPEAGEATDPVNPEVRHRFHREGETLRAETLVGGSTAARALVEYALGSGHRGMTMVGSDESGTVREFRLSYYAEDATWDLTGGFPKHPTDPRDYLGRPLTSGSVVACLHCHTTDGRSMRRGEGPATQDRGIGCERCHGPAAHHLAAVEGGFAEMAIARPRIATAAQRVALCGQCHRSTGSLSDTDPGFVRFQSSTLVKSRCYTESGGKFDCMTCHDPHRDAETDPAFYEAKCLACHTSPEKPTSAERPAKVCPVEPRSNCLPCHMPRVPNAVPHATYSDHHIRVHRR
jgi:tetratricopeptide (TPR) repeat protein